MKKPAKATIEVRGTVVNIVTQNEGDYICLTDIARFRKPDATDDLIRNWLRNRNTVEFLGVWEQIHNPGFNPVEFDGIKMQAGLNSFTLTPKQWNERTGAIGLISKAGRYGGTYAHKDIAFEFASWISVEFKLYLIKESQRFKDEENDRLKLDWSLQRTLAKINYRIHTDAIKDTLIPPSITKAQVFKERGRLAHTIPLHFSVSDFQISALTHSPRRPHQPRKPEFRPHPPGPATARTTRHPQRHRHHTDADPVLRQQRKASEMSLHTSHLIPPSP
jgi:hypothetical protein